MDNPNPEDYQIILIPKQKSTPARRFTASDTIAAAAAVLIAIVVISLLVGHAISTMPKPLERQPIPVEGN